MAMDDTPRSSETLLAEPTANIIELTCGINQIAAGEANRNGYALRNEILLTKKKREILYKNGYTLPVSAQALMAEAQRSINHSRKLGRNMGKGNSDSKRPEAVDAHHIVAQRAKAARPSRWHLFQVGVGINDADNGCYLTRYRAIRIANMPNASWHQEVHTIKYHLNVLDALQSAEAAQAGVRAVLRAIRNQLTMGVFPY